MKRAFPIHLFLIFSVIGPFVSSLQAQSKSIFTWQTDVAQSTIGKLLFMPGTLNVQAQVPFASPASYNTLVQQRGLAAADLNGDGLSDVVASTPNGVVVLINEGDGTFAQPALNSVNFAACCANGVVATDFNHDGTPDVAIPAGGGIGILLNTGSGGALGPASYYESGSGQFSVSITAGDFYHSGHNDIALMEVGFFGCCATITIFKNQGNGTFVKTLQQSASDGGGQIISSDVNGDGYFDLITANANGNNVISVLINQQNGTFAPSQDYVNTGAASVAATDLNGDSRPDLVIWGWGFRSFAVSFAVLMNNGNGTFAAPVYYDTTFAADAQPIHIGLADFDGNRTSDIAAYVGFNPFRILILPGNGDGTFSAASTTIPLPLQANGNPGPLLAADLDANGAVDLVAGDNTNNVIYAMLNQRLPPANLGLRLSTNRGGNTGSVTVTIFGQVFVSGTAVKLMCSGQPDIVGGSTSISSAGTSLTTTFNLSSSTPGQCSVIITQPSGPTLIVPQPFTIVQGGTPDIWLDLIGPSTLRGGAARPYYITFGNRGSVDAGLTKFWISFPTFMKWELPDDQNLVAIGRAGGSILLALEMNTIPTAATDVVPIRLKAPDTPDFAHRLFEIKAWHESLSSTLNRTKEGDQFVQQTSVLQTLQNASLLDCINNGPPDLDTCPDPTNDRSRCKSECIETYRSKLTACARLFSSVNYEAGTAHLEHFLLFREDPIQWGPESSVADEMESTTMFGDIHKDVEMQARIKAFSEARALPEGTTSDINFMLSLPVAEPVPFRPWWITLCSSDDLICKITNLLSRAVGTTRDHGTGDIFLGFGTMNSIIPHLQGTIYKQVDVSGCEVVGFTGRIRYEMSDFYDFPIQGGRHEFFDYEGGYLQACNAARPFSTSLTVDKSIEYFDSSCWNCQRPSGRHSQSALSSSASVPPCPPPACNDCTSITVEIVTSNDPNDKVGPRGASVERWLSGEEPLRYSIFFENKPSATAPAQDVVITDQLDQTNLDLTNLSLGPITFVDKIVTPQPGLPLAVTGELNADVDLRPANNLIVRINVTLNQSTNVLTWRFTSIDPTTGEPPEDPLAGFLAPGAEGAVFFTVRPKNGRSTGTRIRNKATIVFDVNPPLDTQEWSNTLDNTKPTSSVLPLTATQSSTSFNVQWAGTDKGSGIRDFTVYVSDNGAPFTPWLTQTPITQAIFTGLADHTYSFFSVARDLTNNLEDAKSVAEAITRVVTNRPPLARGKNITVRADASCKARVVPADVDDGSVDPDGDEIVLTLRPAGPFTLGPHTVTLTATDSHGASESVSAIITVIDQTSPTITKVSANPSIIWPPDRRMVDVFVGYEVADNCGQTVSRLEVSSNEPFESFDVEIVDAHRLRLRAGRRGGGNGRTYKITIIVMDGFGNMLTKDVMIRVPHDQRN